MLPLYEAKMIHHFDHRFGDYRDVKIAAGKQVRQLPTPDAIAHANPVFRVLPVTGYKNSTRQMRSESKPGKPAFHARRHFAARSTQMDEGMAPRLARHLQALSMSVQ